MELMNIDDVLFGDIECLLFVLGAPVAIKELAKAVGIGEYEMRDTLLRMNDRFAEAERGLMLYVTDESVQLVTNPSHIRLTERFISPPKEKALSQSMMETLAIVAYKQPASRGDIEAIRGVRCEYAVSQLLKLGLIYECGKRETVGRPSEFATTDAFLRLFGLHSLEELPEHSKFMQTDVDESGEEKVF